MNCSNGIFQSFKIFLVELNNKLDVIVALNIETNEILIGTLREEKYNVTVDVSIHKEFFNHSLAANTTLIEGVPGSLIMWEGEDASGPHV